MRASPPTERYLLLDWPLPGYTADDEADVVGFLFEHVGLWAVLKDAPDRVAHTFGKAMPLRLRVFRDREEPSHKELVVEILTGACGSDAWSAADAKIHLLYTEWLSTLPRETTRDVLFVVEPF